MKRKCPACKKKKALSKFYNTPGYCVPCMKDWRKRYYLLNKEYTKKKVREWVKKNKRKALRICKKIYW